MRCTDKEQETCQVEKMGCKGCAYYEEETVVYEDDSTNYRHANVCVGSCRCGAKSEKDLLEEK